MFQQNAEFFRTCGLPLPDQYLEHRYRLDRMGLPEAQRQSHEAARSYASKIRSKVAARERPLQLENISTHFHFAMSPNKIWFVL